MDIILSCLGAGIDPAVKLWLIMGSSSQIASEFVCFQSLSICAYSKEASLKVNDIPRSFNVKVTSR